VSHLGVGFTNAVRVPRWCRRPCGEALGVAPALQFACRTTKRADERTRTAGLLLLRGRGLGLLSVARPCESHIGVGLSTPCLAIIARRCARDRMKPGSRAGPGRFYRPSDRAGNVAGKRAASSRVTDFSRRGGDAPEMRRRAQAGRRPEEPVLIPPSDNFLFSPLRCYPGKIGASDEVPCAEPPREDTFSGKPRGPIAQPRPYQKPRLPCSALVHSLLEPLPHRRGPLEQSIG